MEKSGIHPREIATFKKDGVFENLVDEQRVVEFMKKVNIIRKG